MIAALRDFLGINSSKVHNIVLDAFGGSGSTLPSKRPAVKLD